MASTAVRFDRGTLLLGESLEGVGGVWDPRVGAYRAPAHRYAALVERAKQAKIDLVDSLAGVCSKSVGEARWTRPPLRRYQEDALGAWSARGKRGTLVLPTGAGKTRIAIAAMADTGVPALVLVPTRVLLEQWEQQVAEWYDGAIGVVGDGACRIEAVTIMTFESAYRRLDEFGDRFGHLVVDEVHHFAGGLRAEALEMSIAPVRLGLTATAPTEGSAGAACLAALIGSVACEIGLGELVGVHLADFDIMTLHVGLTTDEKAEYEHLTRPFLELRRAHRRAYPGADWASALRAIGRTRDGREAITAFHLGGRIAAFPLAKRALVARLLEEHRADRVLVFTAGAEDAYAIAEAHLIPVITSETSRVERKEILERFDTGTYRAIVSARVLNEGVDVPDARVAVVVSGGLGVREHVQRIGRVLRPSGDKRALVLELVTRGTVDDDRARTRRRDLATRIAARV